MTTKEASSMKFVYVSHLHTHFPFPLLQTDNEKHESEKTKAPSEALIEIKQEQTDSAPLTEQSNPCQVVMGERLSVFQEMFPKL